MEEGEELAHQIPRCPVEQIQGYRETARKSSLEEQQSQVETPPAAVALAELPWERTLGGSPLPTPAKRQKQSRFPP